MPAMRGGERGRAAAARAASEAGQSGSSVDREARRSKTSAPISKFRAGAENSQVKSKNPPANPQLRPGNADVQGAG